MEQGESLENIRAIINANPEMLRRRNQAGSLPIHHALDETLSPEIVRELVVRWPGSVFQRTKDQFRFLSAHLACLRASEVVGQEAEEEDDDDEEAAAGAAAAANALETLRIVFRSSTMYLVGKGSLHKVHLCTL